MCYRFSAWGGGHLVYGEIVQEVMGNKLEWPGYGFYMEVPDGVLATGVYQCGCESVQSV